MSEIKNDAPPAYVVEMPQGGWRIAGTRISLDSIVHAYLEGRSPEAMVDSFPTLTLEQVYGALAFYLKHRETIDQYLRNQHSRWEQLQAASNRSHGSLLDRIRSQRHATTSTEGNS